MKLMFIACDRQNNKSETTFDFFDENASVNLEDVVFIGKKGIICDTITHEKYCAVSDELLHEIKKNRKY